MSRTLLPLRGYKSLRVLNAFHSLLLGLKMLPVHAGTDYEEFFASFKTKTDLEKETALRQATAFVQLSPEEIAAMVSFATDRNGVPYCEANIDNLKPDEIFEIIVLVCMEIGRIKIDLVSEDEKKIVNYSIDLRKTYVKHPELLLSELLNLAYFEAFQGVL